MNKNILLILSLVMLHIPAKAETSCEIDSKQTTASAKNLSLTKTLEEHKSYIKFHYSTKLSKENHIITIHNETSKTLDVYLFILFNKKSLLLTSKRISPFNKESIDALKDVYPTGFLPEEISTIDILSFDVVQPYLTRKDISVIHDTLSPALFIRTPQSDNVLAKSSIHTYTTATKEEYDADPCYRGYVTHSYPELSSATLVKIWNGDNNTLDISLNPEQEASLMKKSKNLPFVSW